MSSFFDSDDEANYSRDANDELVVAALGLGLTEADDETSSTGTDDDDSTLGGRITRSLDVLLLIGDKEFEESSHFLRSVSDIFEEAFQQGEPKSRFEFPDKDPKEWEQIRQMLVPLSSTQITMDNFDIALTWFDELGVTAGLKACDRFLVKRLHENDFILMGTNAAYDPPRSTVGKLLGYLQACYASHLDQSKVGCTEIVRKLVENKASSMDQDHWRVLCAVLANHKHCRRALWGSLVVNIPERVLSGQEGPEELLSNDLLPEILYGEIHKREKDAGVKEIILTATSSFKSSNNWSAFQALRDNHVCAQVLNRPTGAEGNQKGKAQAWQALWNSAIGSSTHPRSSADAIGDDAEKANIEMVLS